MATKKTPTSFHFDPDTARRIAALAKKLATSRTQVIREAVRMMAKKEGIA